MTPPLRPCPRPTSDDGLTGWRLTKRQAWRTAVHRRRFYRQNVVPFPCENGHWHVGPRDQKRA